VCVREKIKGKGGKVKLGEGKKETNTEVNEMNEGVSGGVQVRSEDTLPRTKIYNGKVVNEKRKCGDSMKGLNDADAKAIRGEWSCGSERILCP